MPPAPLCSGLPPLSESGTADAATGSEILNCAAGLFGLPADKFVSGSDEDSVFKIPDGMGFKDPKVAFRAKEKL